jgi:hypothetical protein
MEPGAITRWHALKTAARRSAFAMLRSRQPIWLHDASGADLPRRLRVVHIGNSSRGRGFIERLYGHWPAGKPVGRAWITAAGAPRLPALPAHDLLLVEINRSFSRSYRRAGYLTLPEWVEFGSRVVTDREEWFRRGGKSLRSDLRFVKANGFDVTVTRDAERFDSFYREMYLPHVSTRFGTSAIDKSHARLRRDFRRGFLMLLEREGSAVAGAIVRVDGDVVSETTLGILSGRTDILRSGVSAILDYHLHIWAAEHGKRFLCVGHTRPFPRDGVYFNKRKWLNSIMPDADGVMDMAMRFSPEAEFPAEVFQANPFVYAGERGLGVLAVQQANRPLDLDETRKLIRVNWTDGLNSLILLCPGGFRPGVCEAISGDSETTLHLCVSLNEALRAYRAPA